MENMCLLKVKKKKNNLGNDNTGMIKGGTMYA